MPGERVLVIGATRGTGRHIARCLLRDGWRVRVLARDEARARELFGDAAEVVRGDVTRPETLPPAFTGVDHVVLTAAVTQRPAGEARVKATVYDGTLHVLAAARRAGLSGRLLYMSALGTTRASLLGFLLNRIKGNTLAWRRRAEEEIRRSGVSHTIVHAGILTDDPPGRRRIEVGQEGWPMSPRYRIARADVAEVFARALRDPRTRDTTFDVAWAREGTATDWEGLFAGLAPDPAR